MMTANAFSLVGGGLEPAVAAYALRLNRVFGPSRVGWSVCGTFLILALLHVTQPAILPGMAAGLPAVIWLVVVLLLLIGLAHTDAFISGRVAAENHERILRRELDDAKSREAQAHATIVSLHREARRHAADHIPRSTARKLDQEHTFQALARMAGGIAHHFNNLLTPILAYTTLLLEDNSGQRETSEALKEIGRAAGRARDITRQLHSFSGCEPLDPQPVDATTLLVGLNTIIAPVLGHRIALKTQYRGGLPPVLVDRRAVEVAVAALARNARDAMAEGGTLTLGARTAHVDKAHAEQVAGAHAGTFVCLCIADTGCGMSAEIKERLFEPFFTTRDVGRALGLGLSATHGIVSEHGGWIEVASAPGAGTEFKLFLPTAE